MWHLTFTNGVTRMHLALDTDIALAAQDVALEKAKALWQFWKAKLPEVRNPRLAFIVEARAAEFDQPVRSVAPAIGRICVLCARGHLHTSLECRRERGL